jgi:hypothetical protein
MGQQQLLLLVFGIVIVAVATISGIQVFKEGDSKFEEDRERLAMLSFVTEAQVWKMKPAIFGGGANGNDADFTGFKPASIGLTVGGNAGTTPYVLVNEVGCFRFFPSASNLQINALNDDCVLGSWDKGIVVSGASHDDIVWIYP